MHNRAQQTAKDITDYFNVAASGISTGSETLTIVVQEMLQDGQPVSQKTLVARLINKLETESDAAVLQRYRQVLEHLLLKHTD